MKKVYLLFFVFIIVSGKAQTITTIAGNGVANYSGDGGLATNASIQGPYGITSDPSGNIYFADIFNNRVRKINSNGIITTMAGSGGQGFAGDSSIATNASLFWPHGVAVDTIGNVYIADMGNNRVRRVDTSGIITTIAGSANGGYGGDGGLAINALLFGPYGVAINAANNLFIADYGNHRIRKVDGNGIITTVAGTGSAGYTGDGGLATNACLNHPSAIAFDTIGNLYIAEYGNSVVRKVSVNGIISTFAGNGGAGYGGDGGFAIYANLNSCDGVCTDAHGNVYIADTYNSLIRKVDPIGVITTFAGTAGAAGFLGDGDTATNAELYFPRGVTVDVFGNVLISDESNERIRKVSFGAETNIRQLNNLPQISIYPSPASNFVIIRSSNNMDETKITDILGNEVGSLGIVKAVSKGNKDLEADVSSLCNGVYFLTVTSEGKSHTEKFIVSH